MDSNLFIIGRQQENMKLTYKYLSKFTQQKLYCPNGTSVFRKLICLTSYNYQPQNIFIKSSKLLHIIVISEYKITFRNHSLNCNFEKDYFKYQQFWYCFICIVVFDFPTRTKVTFKTTLVFLSINIVKATQTHRNNLSTSDS